MDLRVTYLREVFPVTRMVELIGPPHQLILYGPVAADVTDIEINSTLGYPFVIGSDHSIVVTLPPLMTVKTVAVMGRTMGGLKEAFVKLGTTTHPTAVSGLDLLIQNFLKCLFATPGKDAFSKDWGGGLLGLTAKTLAHQADFLSASVECVTRTTKLVIARQLSDLSIPRSERLLSAQVVNTQASPDGSLQISIDVKNQEGRMARVGVS